MPNPNLTAEQLAKYLETLSLLERVHHQMITVVKDELDRRHEEAINWVQALLLHRVSGRDVTAAQLCQEGEYDGANVSYNLVKLTNAGYVHREPSLSDGRFLRVRLTPKGEAISKMIEMLFDRHLLSLEAVANIGASELNALNRSLRRLERSRDLAGFDQGDQTSKDLSERWASAA